MVVFKIDTLFLTTATQQEKRRYRQQHTYPLPDVQPFTKHQQRTHQHHHWTCGKDEVPAATKFIQGSVMLRAVKAIIACPSNVIRMSQSMAGLTETSINLAIVRTEKGKITVHSLMRSAIDTAKADLAERVRCIFELAGADSIGFAGGYSGWRPKLDTPMNKVMMEQFQKVYGYPMKIMATHGGLECAIMGAKYPNWEMVSVGPTVKFPHSPDEKVNVPSVARTWEYLKAVLEAVPEK